MENTFHVNLTFDNDDATFGTEFTDDRNIFTLGVQDVVITPTQDMDVDFDTNFDDGNSDFGAGFNDSIMVSTTDHRDLSHRNAPNQHSISSITDLSDTLEECPDEYMSNIEIYEILQT